MLLQRIPILVGLLAPLVAAAPNATNTSIAAPYSPTQAPMFQLSSDSQFAFYLEETLALANNLGSATGEVLRIAVGLIPKDFESTYNSFLPMAEAIESQAKSAEANNDTISARQAYFRAASYYRGADFFLIGNQSDPRNYELWDKQLNAFDKAVSMMDFPISKFSVTAHSPNVPGGIFQTIGRFYKAPGSHGKTPTVVMGSGYDGSQEELFHGLGLEILKHGYNVVTYEGPGQPTVRRQQQIGFIPDWYNVATPVVDYLSGRFEVDMEKLALIGISYGGTLAPIAASREPRFTQLLAIDGLVDLQQETNAQWPSEITDLYKNGSVKEFNAALHDVQVNTTWPSSFRWIVDQTLWAFNTTSPYDAYTRLGNITMSPEIVKTITQPAFVAKGQDDLESANQPQLAYQSLVSNRPNGKNLTTFHEFKTATGAGEHTCIGAEAQLAQVVLEWLKGQWEKTT